MNELVFEKVSLPVAVSLVFERRLVVGTYVNPADAVARARSRVAYGAVAKTYVASGRHEKLMTALRTVVADSAAGFEAKRVASAALRDDGDFTWQND